MAFRQHQSIGVMPLPTTKSPAFNHVEHIWNVSEADHKEPTTLADHLAVMWKHVVKFGLYMVSG